jgi:tetratricopeptide (TPR) repeat protein
VTLARLLRRAGRIEEARPLLEQFRASEDGADAIVRAEALCDLGAVLALSGGLAEAGPLLEEGLRVLELNEAWPALAEALINRCIYLIYGGRRQEGTGVLRQALALAEERDLPAVALRARANLIQLLIERDRFEQVVDEAKAALVVARERGDRLWERAMFSQQLPALFFLGRWDETVELGRPLLTGQADLDAVGASAWLGTVAAARGDKEMMERCLNLAEQRRESTYTDLRVAAENVLARDAIERGEPREAMEYGWAVVHAEGIGYESIEEAYALSIEAANLLGDTSPMAELYAFVADLPPARATPLLRAGRARLQAELAHRAGDENSSHLFEEEAIALLRSVGARPLLAQALLERARRHGDSEALTEARAIYEELGATRWLERIGETREVVA